ncbi:hypothetical protein BKI52_36730 [marine bacterium AO1-C]|nr:hypothetical protein BKI52_36730 [marine bacterium AO1-C]
MAAIAFSNTKTEECSLIFLVYNISFFLTRSSQILKFIYAFINLFLKKVNGLIIKSELMLHSKFKNLQLQLKSTDILSKQQQRFIKGGGSATADCDGKQSITCEGTACFSFDNDFCKCQGEPKKTCEKDAKPLPISGLF